MKTVVTFRSAKFPACEGEEERLNPGVWGQRLAEYCAAALTARGIDTDQPIAEDWGWYVPVRHDGFRLGLCCGHQDGEDDEFLCFTEPARPVVKKFFKSIDATAELSRLTSALDQILTSDPEIHDVVWEEPGDRR